MIAIYINDKLADYFGDITIKKNSPIFAPFDEEPSEHTYTLTLPTTATNVRIFEFLQYTFKQPKPIPARIEVDGVAVLDGTCRVQSWNEGGYSVYFTGVAPFEGDISAIKKLYADKRMLFEVFDGFSEWIGLDTSNIEILQWNSKVAIARAYAEVRYWGTNAVIPSTDNRIGFSTLYLIHLIEQYYGVTISVPFLADHLIVTNVLPNEYYDEATFISSCLPRCTAQEFLQSLAVMNDARLKLDFANNQIQFSFFDYVETILDDEPLRIDSHSIEWKENTTISKSISMKKVDPIKYDYESAGRPMTALFELTFPAEREINPNGKNEYQVKFAYPEINYTAITLAEDSEYETIEDEDDKNYPRGYRKPKNLEDNQWGYSVFAQLDASAVIDKRTGWFVDTNIKPSFDGFFAPLIKVIEKNVYIKAKLNLNPLHFISLDLMKSHDIESVGRVLISSITYKSNGESEIEGYLI